MNQEESKRLNHDLNHHKMIANQSMHSSNMMMGSGHPD